VIRAVHHISLSTTDMDKFVHFYRDLLGVKLDRVSPLTPGFEAFETVVGLRNVCAQVAQFDLGNMNMEVFCYTDPTPRPGERRPAIAMIPMATSWSCRRSFPEPHAFCFRISPRAGSKFGAT
jgi:catechol 2,3-dioxygenase-like lactoylglutathione lyase family enzyme